MQPEFTLNRDFSVMKKVISDAISVGAPAYNAGNIRECVRIYQSVTEQLLDDLYRSELSDEGARRLEEALKKSRNNTVGNRINSTAWTLRKALDFVYEDGTATAKRPSELSISERIAEAIQSGAPQFNKGNFKACVLRYRQLAQTLLAEYDAMLSPEALTKLREASGFAEENNFSATIAWKLRNVFDFVYDQEKAKERFVMELGTERTLLDFSGTTRSALEFVPVCVNDAVMGGLSRSSFIVGPDFGKFSGYVTTERNGGFASMKFVPQKSRLLKAVLQDTSGLEVSLRNLEGENSCFKLQVSTEKVRGGVSWQIDFDLPAQSDFATLNLPFNKFIPTYRGQVIGKRGELNPSKVESIGFMLSKLHDNGGLSDRFRPGPFALAIRWIKGLK